MRIILLKDINKLGKKGEVKNVSDGFAMNFLLPQKMAEKATEEKIQFARSQENKTKEQAARGKQEREELLKKLNGIKLIITGKASDGGKLFKGIAASELADELKKQKKIELPEKFINLKKHLKDLGEHRVKIKIGGMGEVEIAVMVEAEV